MLRLPRSSAPDLSPYARPASCLTSYDLEYGTDTLEVHCDAVRRGAKVLMVDDLLATGGTMAAACRLIEKIGGRVAGIAFLVELCELAGRDKLAGYKITTLISY